MSKCVVSDYMSPLDNFAYDIGPLARIPANHEETRVHIVLAENIQQMQRVGIVWAIIESERDLPGSFRQSAECAPKPLACGRHGLISRRNHRGAGDNA